MPLLMKVVKIMEIINTFHGFKVLSSGSRQLGERDENAPVIEANRNISAFYNHHKYRAIESIRRSKDKIGSYKAFDTQHKFATSPSARVLRYCESCGRDQVQIGQSVGSQAQPIQVAHVETRGSAPIEGRASDPMGDSTSKIPGDFANLCGSCHTELDRRLDTETLNFDRKASTNQQKCNCGCKGNKNKHIANYFWNTIRSHTLNPTQNQNDFIQYTQDNKEHLSTH